MTRKKGVFAKRTHLWDQMCKSANTCGRTCYATNDDGDVGNHAKNEPKFGAKWQSSEKPKSKSKDPPRRAESLAGKGVGRGWVWRKGPGRAPQLGGGLGRWFFDFGGGLLALDVGDTAAAFLNFIRLLAHKSLLSIQKCVLCGRTMKRWLRSFNIFFVLICATVAAGGCAMIKKATAPKKDMATIRLYLEGERADTATAGTVLVTSNKFAYIIEKEPFLNEGDLAKASLVNDPDGSFSIQLQFNDHGTLLMDMYTASNKGRHIVVFSQFPLKGVKPEKPKKNQSESDDSDVTDNTGPKYPAGTPRQSGWVAAVLIRSRISNGSFHFTPDTSHAEAVRIVRGLRNVIAESKKNE
jgi:hypothetical protein